MLRKAIAIVPIVLLVLLSGVYFWARSIFSHDYVRTALAAQLSEYLGQPVSVEGISAGVYPRVTVNLDGVTIGDPARIRVEALRIGTNLRALLSRRIEHATVLLDGARIDLPLPALAVATTPDSPPEQPEGGSPVEIVSIDEIQLRDVQVTSAGRILTGDIELVPRDKGLLIRSLRLNAEGAAIEMTGELTDLAGPVGKLEARSDALHLDVLADLLSDFAAGANLGSSTAKPSAAKGPAMNLEVSIQADKATFGTMALTKLSGEGRVKPDAVRFEPIAFGIFGGSYKGNLTMSSADPAVLTVDANLADIDMQAVTAFAGSPGSLTGRLSGKLGLTAPIPKAGSIVDAARGTARVEILNGVVKNLGLVKTIVVATSGRADAQTGSGGSSDEPFTRLGATLAISGGEARTQDLRFESNDLLLNGAGSVRLDGSAINLSGKVQLSDQLSKQAGRDLVRYTQENGRVTLPVTVTGSASSPRVSIDMAGAAQRALTNKAIEEAERAMKRNLGVLFGK